MTPPCCDRPCSCNLPTALTVAVVAAVECMSAAYAPAHQPYTRPPDPAAFKHRSRARLGTDADGRGMRNRIAKRRARKGYR